MKALALLTEIRDLLRASKPQKEIMNAKETAVYLGVSPSYLWGDLKGTYALPFVRIGKRVMFRKKDVDQWLEERTVRNAQDERRLFDGRRVHLAVKS